MSEQTKQGRAMIYDFLEAKGIDLMPFRGALKKLLISYAKDENTELLREVIVLRDLTRRHRAIIREFNSNKK